MKTKTKYLSSVCSYSMVMVGQIKNFVGTSVDITDQGLWTPERQAIRFLSDPAPHLVWLTDVNGAAIYVNPRWSAVTGQLYEQALGYGWLTIIHPHDKEAALTGFTSAKNQHVPLHTHYRIRRHDGIYTDVVATSHPVFDDIGQYRGYVGSHPMPKDEVPDGHQKLSSSKSFILSRRERAVLTWVAAGLTAEEIAAKLEIAPRTVEFHIHSSARKLKSTNRVQTVAKAALFGEIDLSTAMGQ